MKLVVAIIIYLIIFPEKGYTQYRTNGKPMHMAGIQLKMFDLSPFELSYTGFSQTLVWSIRGGVGRDSYGDFSSKYRTTNPNNKNFSLNCDYISIHFRPGIGIRLINNLKATSCLQINYPIGWNFYTLYIKSDDSLLGNYEKTATSVKLQSAIEVEYYTSFHLKGPFSINSGLALGFKQSEKNPFINEHPGMSNMFNYTPGIGFGHYRYFHASIGMSYLFN